MNRDTVSKVREKFGSNILYLEYQPETDKYGGDIYKKWGDAVRHVSTEYSVICTDKEFLVPTTLHGLINYLDCHPDYSVASGNYYYCHNPKENSGMVKIWSERRSIEYDDGLERYTAAVSGTGKQSLLFALFRAAIHKKVYEPIIKDLIVDIRYGERYLMFCGYIFGKMYSDTNLTQNIRDVSHVISKGKFNEKESSALRYPPLSAHSDTVEPFATSYIGFKAAAMSLLSHYNCSEDCLKSSWDSKIYPIITRRSLDYPDYMVPLLRFCRKQLWLYKLIKRMEGHQHKMTLDAECSLIVMIIEHYASSHLYDNQIKI